MEPAAYFNSDKKALESNIVVVFRFEKNLSLNNN